MTPAPFTPKTLAECWQCSEKLIYRMVGDGVGGVVKAVHELEWPDWPLHSSRRDQSLRDGETKSIHVSRQDA